MSNPMFNPQPNYSGVTIQITNPAVNVNPYNTNPMPQSIAVRNGNYMACPQACYCNPIEQSGNIDGIRQNYEYQNPSINQAQSYDDSKYAQSYPAEYYINKYGKSGSADGIEKRQQNSQEGFSNSAERINNSISDRTYSVEEKRKAIDAKKKIMTHPDCPETVKSELQKEINIIEKEIDSIEQEKSNYNNKYSEVSDSDNKSSYIAGENLDIENFDEAQRKRKHQVYPEAGISPYKEYAKSVGPKEPEDMTASKTIINSLDERNAEIKEAKKNTKEQKIIALTDEYIMSLENYLNNPNDEIRLMASKEILTRLDEDKDRYDDAALNALLNKMLQDPSKLVRLAALSAFASQLACGNDYTVQLLQNMQSNPNADKEDALQAADILLKMAGGIEVKNVPVSEEKREQDKMKQ